MPKRKRKTRSAVASFIRNVKAEIGHVDYLTQDQPLLYPVLVIQPLKFQLVYPEFNEDQIELINYSRSFLAKALNSPFYQLFRKSIDPHALLDQSQKYTKNFVKSLISQRPLSFPEELKKKMKILKDDNQPGIIVSSSNESENSEKENEEKNEENNEDDYQVKGLWEDGVESESLDSEIII